MRHLAAFLLAVIFPGTVWLDRAGAGTAPAGGAVAPEIAGDNWLNSKPLTIANLKGRVVLVEFWTYG